MSLSTNQWLLMQNGEEQSGEEEQREKRSGSRQVRCEAPDGRLTTQTNPAVSGSSDARSVTPLKADIYTYIFHSFFFPGVAEKKCKMKYKVSGAAQIRFGCVRLSKAFFFYSKLSEES